MSEQPRSFHILREAQRTGRHVVIDAVPWLVYELPPRVFDRRASPSLVFESDDTVRRVRGFPAKWRALSDDELVALKSKR